MARVIWPCWSFVFAAFTIAGEELVFRGIALPVLIQGFGILPAIFFTVIAFMGIQAITMPSWEPALIPVSSSMVMGIIQASLAIVQHDMLPLVISHYSFFIILQLLSTPPTSSVLQQQM